MVEPDDISRDIQRLIDIEALCLLKARSIRALDVTDWAAYEALQAPGHVSDDADEACWQGGGAKPAAIAAPLGDVITVHHAHTPETTLTSATTATGIWAMEDHVFWQQDGADR